MSAGVLAVIGGSDCEAIGSGLVAQPVNTITSLAYVGAGVWIIARRHRWKLERSAVVFGALVILAGIGSVLFHAATDAPSRWLHDVGFLGALGFVAGWHVAQLLGREPRRAGRVATVVAAAVLVVMGIVLVPAPDATNVAMVVLVAVATIAYVVGRWRAGVGPSWSDLPFVVVLVVALADFTLGRTSSPACDPNSTFQFHGLWHVATAALAVMWARGALAVRPRGEGAARAGIDSSLAGAVGLVVRGFFREVTVAGVDRIPTDRPVIIVLNHFNGLVDPVVAIHALGRLPRFIAKATLWKVKPARPFLSLAGLIPVYRVVDQAVDSRDAAVGNTSAFAACHAVLAKQGTIAIFPEGTTSARSQLAPVKTGAARIALGAVAQGVEDLVIVPMGLAFEDRVAFRGRAYVEIGEPIELARDLDQFVTPGSAVSEEDRDAVDRLTEEIDARLRACAPDYATPRDEATLHLAAKVALRPDGVTAHEPGFGQVELMARRLSRAPAEAQHAVEVAVAEFALDLRLAHLTDSEITPGPGLLARLRRAAVVIVVLVLLSPVIVFGVLANLVPYLFVRLASRRVRVPVTKGTVRLLVGLVVFPVTWILLAVLFADALWVQLALVLAFAVAGFVALRALEEAVLNARLFRAWRAARGERRWFADNLRDDRRELADAVQRALAAGTLGPRPLEGSQRGV